MATMSASTTLFDSVARNYLAGKIIMAYDLYRCDARSWKVPFAEFERFFARELFEYDPQRFALGMLKRAHSAEPYPSMKAEMARGIEALESFNGFQVRKLKSELQSRQNLHCIAGFELTELALRIARRA
jgi:hypothetical protein